MAQKVALRFFYDESDGDTIVTIGNGSQNNKRQHKTGLTYIP